MIIWQLNLICIAKNKSQIRELEVLNIIDNAVSMKTI